MPKFTIKHTDKDGTAYLYLHPRLAGGSDEDEIVPSIEADEDPDESLPDDLYALEDLLIEWRRAEAGGEILDHTFETLQAKPCDPGKRGRLATAAAQSWMRRASSLARQGLHREADDATSEAIALGRMADSLL